MGASFAAFVVAAVVIVALMFGLSLAVAMAQENVVAALRAHSGDVKRWGGWILVAVGTWLVALAVFARFFARVFPV